MKSSLARFRQSGSFIAGSLIGLSVVLATFAVTDADANARQSFLVFGAPVVLVFGLMLQMLATAKSRRGIAPSAERTAFPSGMVSITDARHAVNGSRSRARTHAARPGRWPPAGAEGSSGYWRSAMKQRPPDPSHWRRGGGKRWRLNGCAQYRAQFLFDKWEESS